MSSISPASSHASHVQHAPAVRAPRASAPPPSAPAAKAPASGKKVDIAA